VSVCGRRGAVALNLVVCVGEQRRWCQVAERLVRFERQRWRCEANVVQVPYNGIQTVGIPRAALQASPVLGDGFGAVMRGLYGWRNIALRVSSHRLPTRFRSCLLPLMLVPLKACWAVDE
jgi:hypothetical protein